MAPPDAQHCLRASVGEATDCSVVREAERAFTARVARMFTGQGSEQLELVLAVTNAEIFVGPTGALEFDFRARVDVRRPNGSDVDRLEMVERIVMFEATLVARAAAEAAGRAAARFEEDFDNSDRVRDYLAGNRLVSASELEPAPLGDRSLSIAAAGTLVQGGGDGSLSIAPGIRAALSIRMLVIQISYSYLRASFTGAAISRSQPVLFDSALTTHDAGLEAALSRRPRPSIELRAGGGVHGLLGTASSSDRTASAAKVVPEVFASAALTVLTRHNGNRLVAGIEARGYFATSLDVPEFNRRIPAANTSFGIFFASEMPWPAHGGAR